MIILEILIAFSAIAFVVFIFGINIYKMFKGKYEGECETCRKRMQKNFKNIRKELNKNCSCDR